jgi:hypothetical protein
MIIMKINFDRRRRVVVSLTTLLVVSFAVMTLAFFTSTDEVTNQISSTAEPEIALSEPIWDSDGEEKATKSVPGAVIEKDPYVINHSGSDVYIRVKLEFTPTPTDTNFNTVMMDSLYYKNSSTSNELVKFFDTKNNTINNPSGDYGFFYNSDDGYFYYGTNSNGSITLTPLAPDEKTVTPLFDAVKISTDYDTYNQYFSENFVINVSAEAVYSEYEKPNEFKKIVKRFEDNNKS